ncbi:hypothetical protein AAEX28_00420 [Lentisphaerota bacterium WC36G]|nr:hypothetical protein LJT99_03300 [Lentisphaerae bacterium WC36]
MKTVNSLILQQSFKLFLIVFITAFLGVNCKKEQAPPVPLSKAEIVQKLFASYRKNDYRKSLEYLKQLKALENDSIVLDQLVDFSILNFYINEVNIKLDNNDLFGAIETIESAPVEVRREAQLKNAFTNLIEIRNLSNEYKSLIKINDVKQYDVALKSFNTSIKNSQFKEEFAKLSVKAENKFNALKAEVIRLQKEKLKKQLEEKKKQQAEELAKLK